MVKRRKVSTGEKATKEIQQNGVTGNDVPKTDEREAGGGARAGEGRRRAGAETAASGRSAKEVVTSSCSTSTCPSAQQPPPPPPVRTSSRVSKRPRRDATPPPSPPKKTAKGDSKSAAATNGTPEAKTRRQWELWSSVDKDVFFEALNEHGKDFDAIQSVIAQRHRKRANATLIRTKEQIRHFYYRTWHKISKFVELKEDVGKHAMELYGLINYGELRKRIGGLLNEKSGQKLNELVHKGATVVKTKGKNYRVRTPICRALKKLNNIEETKEDEQVVIPKQVTLELRPASNGAWATVQAISHNPRLRMHLPSNKRLSAVVSFLNKKWKSQRLRLKESMDATEEMTKELRLTPPVGCDIYPFDVSPVSNTPTVNLALEKFRESSKEKNDGTRSPAAKRVKRNPVGEDHHSEDSAQSMEDVKATGAANGLTVDSSGVTDGQQTAELLKADESQRTTDDFSKKTDSHEPKSDQEVVSTSKEKAKDKDVDIEVLTGAGSSQEDIKRIREEKLRQGWNLQEAEGLTIAELYLLLGCPEKLMLEYDWVELVKRDNVMQLNLALTNMLRRLVQLATTEFSDFSKTRPPLAGLEPSSPPPRTCTCGGQQYGTPPGRASRGSTPKSSAKPGATVSANGANQSAGSAKQTTGTQVSAQSGDQGNTHTGTGVPPAAPGSSGDGVFRIPKSVPIRQSPMVRISPNSQAERTLLQQIELHKQNQDILMPRRPRRQVMRNIRRPPLVVQRTLLPKTGVPTRQIMTFTMLPNQSPVAQTGSFLPVVPGARAANSSREGQQEPEADQEQATIVQSPSVFTKTVITENVAPVVKTPPVESPSGSAAQSGTSSPDATAKPINETSILSQAASVAGITQSGLSDISVASVTSQTEVGKESTAPSLSAILDISLPAPDSNDSATSDSTFLNSISNSTFSSLLESTNPDQVTVEVTEDTSISLPSSSNSPNKTYKLQSTLCSDSQWIDSDDFSLSQFLGDSPLKKNSCDPTLANECSRDSIRLDVDTALQSMMNENSMDYSSKFADLAAQIAAHAPDIAASKFRKTY